MLRFIDYFIIESVIYNKPDAKRQSDEEHGEAVVQHQAIQSGNMDSPHPAIAKAIGHFAQNKNAFRSALARSKIQPVKRGNQIGNSEIGQGSNSVESKTKLQRVKRLIGSNQGIDRPIILRHKDENGQLHHHLLAGNTRATTVGYGVQAHHIDV
jgi:hypothetical protein